MGIQDEGRALLSKPIEKIRQDIFFRADNFQGEPWYDQFQIFLAIGVCQVPQEQALPVRKALKVMGYSTHAAIREGKTYILPGEPEQPPAETETTNWAE